ncbi:hypothetical protein MUK42_01146 [Musa troglodytarum]|uniref:Uncharacterized protein n=1 Tax=Musa troglodytarum TaxID=320322 RepID=A0A9E7FCY6_9LILI|nr:hypothetical protein MUK42_01146 [Musa troglodytarum]
MRVAHISDGSSHFHRRLFQVGNGDGGKIHIVRTAATHPSTVRCTVCVAKELDVITWIDIINKSRIHGSVRIDMHSAKVEAIGHLPRNRFCFYWEAAFVGCICLRPRDTNTCQSQRRQMSG